MRKIYLTSNHIELLKYIAILLMLIDHANTLLLNDIFLLKSVGRFAYPIFVIILVYNYIYNTKDKFNYIKRLLIFGIISEVFFQYAFNFYYDSYTTNIFFTLSSGLFTIYLFENKYKLLNTAQKIFALVIITIFIFIISMFISYGLIGFLLIISFYIYFKNQNIINLIFLSISLFLLNAIWNYYASVLLLLVIPLLHIYCSIKVLHLNRISKYFFYIFYPTHLLFLKLIN